MKILITAGPTREALDPVRFLSNRSSGKMGYSLAEAMIHAGHEVLLISGPTHLDVPHHCDFLPIESAEQMFQAVARHIARFDIAIFSAAVADYRTKNIFTQKIKKENEQLILELERTKDILGAVRTQFQFSGTIVGFAAETENLEANARLKLNKKHCDLIIANDVSRSDIGFDSADNELLLVTPDTTTALPKDSKDHLAEILVPIILEIHQKKIATELI